MRIPVRFLVLIANISLLPATASAQGFPSGYVDPDRYCRPPRIGTCGNSGIGRSRR